MTVFPERKQRKISSAAFGLHQQFYEELKMYTLTFNFHDSGSSAIYCDATVTGKTKAAAYDAALDLTFDEGHNEMVVIELIEPSGKYLIERMV